MGVKHADEMKSRLQNMLTRDKLGLKEGFSKSLNIDITKTLSDYFDITTPVLVDITINESGQFDVNISLSAKRLKTFGSTLDKY